MLGLTYGIVLFRVFYEHIRQNFQKDGGVIELRTHHIKESFYLLFIEIHQHTFKYDEHRSNVLLYRFNPFFIKKR